MSIAGASGDQNQIFISPASVAAPVISIDDGFFSQKCFSPTAIPPETSPSTARPSERWPSMTCSHELAAVVRFSMLKLFGPDWLNLASPQTGTVSKALRACAESVGEIGHAAGR